MQVYKATLSIRQIQDWKDKNGRPWVMDIEAIRDNLSHATMLTYKITRSSRILNSNLALNEDHYTYTSVKIRL